MNNMEIWYTAYVAALASGETSRGAKDKADKALDNYLKKESEVFNDEK